MMQNYFLGIKSAAYSMDLQNDISEVQSWTDKWKLNLNVNKCITVSYDRQIDNSHKCYLRKDASDYKG